MRKWIIMIIVVLFSCNPHENYQEFSFMPQIYPYIDTIYAKHNNNTPFFNLGQSNMYKLVFYVYGDCSSCIAKIVDYQEFVEKNGLLKEAHCVVILYTENIDVLGYNLEKISNALPLYIDTMKIFSSYNGVPFDESNLLLMNDKNEIIYSSIEADGTDVNHFRRIRNMLRKQDILIIN